MNITKVAFLGVPLLFAHLAMFAETNTMDVPLRVTSRKDAISQLVAVCDKLSQQEAIDLGLASHNIKVQCDRLIDRGISVAESDALYVSLIEGRTPRQIILVGAAFMTVEAFSALERAAVQKEHRDDRADAAILSDYRMEKSIGMSLIQRYRVGGAEENPTRQLPPAPKP